MARIARRHSYRESVSVCMRAATAKLRSYPIAGYKHSEGEGGRYVSHPAITPSCLNVVACFTGFLG